MDNRPLFLGMAGVTGVGFAAVAAVVLGLLSSMGRQARNVSPPTPPPTEESQEGEPVDSALLTRGLQLVQDHVGSTGPCRPRCPHITFMVATLPDPFDSRLDWIHDALLESVQRGFQSAGWVIDRFWFPGPGDRVKDSGSLPERTVRAGDLQPGLMLFRKRGGPAEPPAETEGQAVGDAGPDAEGAVTPPDSLALVYMVWELPTSGVHLKALRRALADRLEVTEYVTGSAASGMIGRFGPVAGSRVRPLASQPLRVVGPVFSGSIASLRRGLVAAQAEGLLNSPTHIVSGSATSPGNQAAFAADTGEDDRPPITFHTTIHTDDAYTRALWSVLETLGLAQDGRPVAVLTEASTAYGAGLGGGPREEANRAEQRQRQQRTPEAPDPEAPDSHRTFTRFPFPLNISDLRAEYARNPETGRRVDPRVEAQRSRIPLPLEETAGARELPRARSAVTAHTVELLMDEVAETLQHEQVRVVGLLATDVRDKLFLAQHLRKRLPDLRFFTFESNVLFLTPEYERDLQGMLVLSTYPLSLQHQQRFNAVGVYGNDGDRLPFPNDGALGAYNAVLALLSREGGFDDGAWSGYSPLGYAWPHWGHEGPPVSGDDLACSPVQAGHGETPHDPTATVARPPIWVSVVGTGAVLPVQVCHVADAGPVLEFAPAGRVPAGGGAEAGSDAHPDHDPHPVSPLILAVVILLGGAVVGVAGAILFLPAPGHSRPPPPPQPPPGPDWFRDYRVAEYGGLRIHRKIYQAYAVTALIAAFLPGWFMISRTSPGPQWPWHGLGLVVQAFWWAALIWMALGASATVRGYWARGRDFARVGWDGWPVRSHVMWIVEIIARVGSAVLVLTFAALAFWFARSLADAVDPLTLELVAHRVLRLESGVSPLTPLLFAGIVVVLWSYWHWRRIRLMARGSTAFEDACLQALGASSGRPDPFGSLCQRAGRPVGKIRFRLFMLIPEPSAIPVALGVGAVVGWLFMQRGPTLEVLALGNGSFDWLLWYFLALILAATVWSVFRLLATWRGLQDLLRTVDESFLTFAFARLPRHVAGLMRFSVFRSASPTLTGLLLQAQRRDLTSLGQPDPDGLSRALGFDPRPLLDEPTPAPELGRDRGAPTPGTPAFGEAGRRLGTLIRELGEWWDRQPDPATVRRLVEARSGGDQAAGTTSVSTLRVLRTGPGGPVRLWVRAAEEYVAVQVVAYVRWILEHVRTLALFLFGSLLLTTLLLSSYPFEPRGMTRLVFFFVVLGTVAALVMVMFEMNRNPVLSQIAGTEPGQVNWTGAFILNLAIVGLLPFLVVLGSEFPVIQNTVFAWVNPLLRSFGGG